MSIVLYSTAPTLERLQKMREHWAEEIDLGPEQHDNFLRGKLQGAVCFRRIKHACLLGKYYWIRYRFEDVDAKNYDMCHHVPGETKFPVYQKEGSYLEIMRRDAALQQDTDFADIGIGLGLELECLSSFLAGSVKEETKGKFVLRRPNSRSHFRHSRAAANLPLVEEVEMEGYVDEEEEEFFRQMAEMDERKTPRREPRRARRTQSMPRLEATPAVARAEQTEPVKQIEAKPVKTRQAKKVKTEAVKAEPVKKSSKTAAAKVTPIKQSKATNKSESKAKKSAGARSKKTSA